MILDEALCFATMDARVGLKIAKAVGSQLKFADVSAASPYV